jgi:hypothetical protein
MKNGYSFSEGQTVWVRSLRDILRTLDADGKLDGLPFMPEMIRYCGRSFRVSCLPTKTCVEGVGFRGLTGIVFLDDIRCDGDSHDGCQRGCLLFWKEAWLSDQPPTQSSVHQDESAEQLGANLKTMQGERYFCQSTELAGATSEYQEDEAFQRGKLRQYLGDVWLGEISASEFIQRAAKAVLNRFKRLVGMDTSGKVRGHRLKTDTVSLDLQPGEWVEVKNRKEIEQTLDIDGKNRGLLFDPPMLAYCGHRYRVAGRLQKIILEETGRMIPLQNTVVLDGVTCQAWNCPRANLHFWREIWLKRVVPAPDDAAPGTVTPEASVKRKAPYFSQSKNDT